jgi:hypothetical protein
MNATTTFIRYSEPTVRHDAALAYSQCMPESDYGYQNQPQPQYGSYYNNYSSTPQPPTPVQAPVAKSSSGKGLLFVAGLAVIGAAAFGGVMLLNSGDSQTTRTTATGTAAASDPTASTVVDLPSAVDIAAPAPAQNAQAPVVVNNPAPVHVSGPVSVPKTVTTPKSVTAPRSVTAPKGVTAPAQLAPAPVPAIASAPAVAPVPPSGPGVAIKTPFAEVGVPSKGGVSVKTPGLELGIPGQNGGDVVVAVPGAQTQTDTTKTDGTKTDGTNKEATTPADGGKAADDVTGNVIANMK